MEPPMRYHFGLACPRCGKESETVQDNLMPPHVNCGDCLMERVEIVEMTVTTIAKIEEAKD